jgi:hypothetical protein
MINNHKKNQLPVEYSIKPELEFTESNSDDLEPNSPYPSKVPNNNNKFNNEMQQFPRRLGDIQGIVPIIKHLPKNSGKTILSQIEDYDESYESPMKLLTVKSNNNVSPINRQINTNSQINNKDILNIEDYWNLNITNQNENFFLLPSISQVTLPDELKNEPYTISDNEYRPDIRVKKTYYKFIVQILRNNNSKIYANVEKGIYYRNSIGIPEKHIPEKLKTNISVIDVYENYGLDVTYSYLRYICLDNPISRKNPSWLSFYLETSMIILQNDFKPSIWPLKDAVTQNLYMCSLLLSHFLIIENKKVKILGPFIETQYTIPLEIVSKITDSKRLSKKFSETVQYNKCVDNPMTTEELILADLDEKENYFVISNNNRYYCQYTIKNLDNINEYDYFEYSFDIGTVNNPYRFTLRKINRPYYKHYIKKSDIIQHSLIIYKKAYAKRGCKQNDIKKAILSILYELTKIKITDDNFKDVCGWILQLSVDTGNIEEIILKNYVELKNLFLSILEVATKMVKDNVL